MISGCRLFRLIIRVLNNDWRVKIMVRVKKLERIINYILKNKDKVVNVDIINKDK